MAIHSCAECQKPVSSRAAACPHCGYKPKGILAKGCATIAIGSIIIVCGLIVLGSLGGKQPPASQSTPPATAPAMSAETCREKLAAAQQLDVLSELDWKAPREPRVVAGPTFQQMPFDAKEGFAQTVNCALLGGSDRFISFDILDHLNHRVLGRWEYGRLKMK